MLNPMLVTPPVRGFPSRAHTCTQTHIPRGASCFFFDGGMRARAGIAEGRPRPSLPFQNAQARPTPAQWQQQDRTPALEEPGQVCKDKGEPIDGGSPSHTRSRPSNVHVQMQIQGRQTAPAPARAHTSGCTVRDTYIRRVLSRFPFEHGSVGGGKGTAKMASPAPPCTRTWLPPPPPPRARKFSRNVQCRTGAGHPFLPSLKEREQRDNTLASSAHVLALPQCAKKQGSQSQLRRASRRADKPQMQADVRQPHPSRRRPARGEQNRRVPKPPLRRQREPRTRACGWTSPTPQQDRKRREARARRGARCRPRCSAAGSISSGGGPGGGMRRRRCHAWQAHATLVTW